MLERGEWCSAGRFPRGVRQFGSCWCGIAVGACVMEELTQSLIGAAARSLFHFLLHSRKLLAAKAFKKEQTTRFSHLL